MAALKSIEVEENGKKAKILTPSNFILQIYLGEPLPQRASKINVDQKQIEINFKNGARLKIDLVQKTDWIDVYRFSWKKPPGLKHLRDVVEMDIAPWYGGAMLLQQEWPINKNGYKLIPYVVYDTYIEQLAGFERYWLCSKKIAVHVPSNVPLWTCIQKGHLGLQAQHAGDPYDSFSPPPEDNFLNYEIWVCNDEARSLSEFHMECSRSLLGKPEGYPDPYLIEKPIWTTWAKYGKGITEYQVLEFAKMIVDKGFEISQLELDDMWTAKYGDFDIHTKKFPDFHYMIYQLRQKGIRLTAWMHPFVNLDSNNGLNKDLHKFFVQTKSGQPGITKWWNGSAYLVDFTNPEACRWFGEQLEGVKKLGVYSFKFDAGEVHYLPKDYRLHTGTEPNDYSRAYTRFCARFGNAVEARVGSGTQDLPIMLRTIDRESRWVNIGLQTILPTVLNMSLHGYFWNLPDMIGGNGNDFSKLNAGYVNTIPEDKELYIRWVNTFLISMQFSFPPWEFDDYTVNVVKEMLKLRSKWVGYIIGECEKAVKTRIPVYRPLWWQLESPEAFNSSDQFFVGDDLLVAPVVNQGAKIRDVYLPEGKWKDHTGRIIQGPCKVNVKTPLEVLPFYERVSDEEKCTIEEPVLCRMLSKTEMLE